MDDSEIIELYWSRSEAAISNSQQTYGAYCFTIANNILGNREDSEECVNTQLFYYRQQENCASKFGFRINGILRG